MKKLTLLILLFIINFSLKAQMPPPPALNPGETWTNLYSVSQDYQTPGSVRYIVQDPVSPNNLCAILWAQQDSNTAAGVERYVYYAYSDNNGVTWTTDVLDTSFNWGSPCLSLASGVPVIAAHRFNAISDVYRDVIFGGFSFSNVGVMPTNIIPGWPHVTGTENGNITVITSANDGTTFGGYFSTYNGSSWSQWIPLPLAGGPSGNYAIDAGTNGNVGIFATDYIGTRAIRYYKSTDNGLTFDNGTVIFEYLVEGGDTLFANLVGGLQAAYNLDEPHLVFAAYNATSNIFPNANTIEFVKPKILHWSPSTGVTQVAGKFNIPNLTDTITTALMAPVGQPSLSKTPSGRLICSFTTFVRGNTQIVENGNVLNAGEIFVTKSDDNGVTWSTPVNVTNTPAVEEKHSSLLSKASSDSLKIYYLRDMKAGGWVNVAAWGKAPVYGIYLSKQFPVGISQINSIAVSYELSQNYPNPFNPSTNLEFGISDLGFVSLKVYDILGKEVMTLVNERLSPGEYKVEFDGSGLTSGVYFYRLTSGDYTEVKKMTLLK